MTKSTVSPEDIATAEKVLRKAFPRGARVTPVTTHRPSGTSSSLRVLAVIDGEIMDVSWAVSRVTGWKIDRTHGGVRVTGGNIGHDHHLVYTLARRLYEGANVDTLSLNRV